MSKSIVAQIAKKIEVIDELTSQKHKNSPQYKEQLQ
jgi:hypothetical protein